MRGCRRIAAFTLVELLVVISIIALLIAIALPAFTGVRTKAKETAVQAQLSAVDTGLELFRGERSLGGRLPPSASDMTGGTSAGKIVDPTTGGSPTKKPDVYISGASLLVYALAGADKSGTAGFRVVGSGRTTWAESMGGGSKKAGDSTEGLYAWDDQDPPQPVYPRYPGNGGTYAGADLEGSIIELGDLNKIQEAHDCNPNNPNETPGCHQLVFVDKFDMPILYYRARKAASIMVTVANTGAIGVYDHRDNSLITGGIRPGDSSQTVDGIWPDVGGPRKDGRDPGQHVMNNAGDFAQYIVDPQSNEVNPKPIRADSYLLISAGADRRYGTKDDIKNWSK